MNINDIFTKDKYSEAYSFIKDKDGLSIEEIEPEKGKRRYKIVKIPDKSIEQKCSEFRMKRDEAINNIIWRIERYEQQKKLNISTSDSEEDYMNILLYIQYLRDLPNDEEFPNLEIKELKSFLESEKQ